MIDVTPILEIRHTESAMLIVRRDLQQTIYTDGRTFERNGRHGEALQATTAWRGGRLFVETKTENGAWTEIYELVDDGNRFFITLKSTASGRRPEIEITRIYDRVAPEEATSDAGETDPTS